MLRIVELYTKVSFYEGFNITVYLFAFMKKKSHGEFENQANLQKALWEH